MIEFREPSWYDERAYSLLRRHKVAFCLHDMQGSASGKLSVGPLVYVRFHGWTKYAGRYEDERLDEWSEWLAGRARDGLDVFAYFNPNLTSEDGGAARPAHAGRVSQHWLSGRPATRPSAATLRQP